MKKLLFTFFGCRECKLRDFCHVKPKKVMYNTY